MSIYYFLQVRLLPIQLKMEIKEILWAGKLDIYFSISDSEVPDDLNLIELGVHSENCYKIVHCSQFRCSENSEHAS